jgi:hypothetical protein
MLRKLSEFFPKKFPKTLSQHVTAPLRGVAGRGTLSSRKLTSFLTLLLVFISIATHAQELNCKVKVLHEKIQNVDAQVFTSMERAITDFVNTRKWTGDDYMAQERIECNMLINLTARSDKDPDLWTATLSVQATRPVYNSGYTSPTVNTVDRDVVFHYTQFNPLTFDDNRVTGPDVLASNLTAVLAYYAYLMLALDYDSFSPNGGTALLKKAQNVVTNAPEDAGIKGWKAFEEKRNRYWIVDQFMWNKPADGRIKVLAALNTLQTVLRDNPQSTLIQTFFDAKSDEITRIVMQGNRDERVQYLTMLSQIDAVNAGKYSALK